jgi:phosphopentomutase
MKRLRLFLIAGLLTPCLLVAGRASAEEVVQVFILAGQSNMEGHGNVALTEQAVDRMTKQQTFERDKNGYLEYLAKQSRDTEKFKHLLDDDGHWAQRDDGLYYRQMVNEVDDALNNLPSLFPEYQKTDRYQIAGFV